MISTGMCQLELNTITTQSALFIDEKTDSSGDLQQRFQIPQLSSFTPASFSLGPERWEILHFHFHPI